MKKIAFCLACAMALSLCGCSLLIPAAGHDIEYEYGRMEGGAIVSERFNFKMPIPEGWRPMSIKEIEEVADTAALVTEPFEFSFLPEDAEEPVYMQNFFVLKNIQTEETITFDFLQIPDGIFEHDIYKEEKEFYQQMVDNMGEQDIFIGNEGLLEGMKVEVGELTTIQYCGETYHMFMMALSAPAMNLFLEDINFLRCEDGYLMDICATMGDISELFKIMRTIEPLH